MERPNIGILLSPDCLLWTEHGLLAPNELNPGDNLICSDSKSNLSKFPLPEKPFYYGRTELISIDTKHNSTLLGGDVNIFTPQGRIKAKDVERGTTLEMLPERKCNEIRKICVPKENQTKIFGITISDIICLCLAIARPHVSPSVVFSPTINNYLLPDLEKTLATILPQLKSQIGGKLYRKPQGSFVFKHDGFYRLCQKINFQQGRLYWFKGWATQETTLEIPKFLRDNGLKLMGSFFSGIIGFRCRVAQNTKYISIQTPKKLQLARSFIHNLAWIFGLNVHKKWPKGNGNWAMEFKADDFNGEIGRNTDYAQVLTAIPERNEAYCLQIPTNWTTWVDNLPVRAHKINYEN
jgi:hypothetical protein